MEKPEIAYEQMSREELIREVAALRERRDRVHDRASLAQELELHQEELRIQHEELKHAQQLLEASRDEYAALYDFAPLAYLTLDRNGIVTAINLTGCALLGIERARALGLPFSGVVAPENRRALLDHLRRCRAGSGPVATELNVVPRGGAPLCVQVISRSAQGASGESEYRTALTDLTAWKEARRKVEELNATLEERVRQRTAEWEASNAELRREIARRRQIEEQLRIGEARERDRSRELERLAEELREADRRKDDFLAMLGHELRNPLAPIVHAVEVWRVTPPDDPILDQLREVIQRQAQQLTRLIDDLLDISRIARGKITITPERIDLAALVRTTVADCRAALDEGGLAFQIDTPSDPVWVEGDATRLNQVMSNLLHNSLKFTDRKGRIEVCVRCPAGGRHALVVVRDTGVGMDHHTLQHAFETFAQGESSVSRSQGGLGLGLALVKGLVELHGGSVELASEGPGLGTECRVNLPLAGPPIANDHGPRAPLSAAVRGALRIVVIDDRRDVRETLRRLLTTMGHEVVVADNGVGGLEAAREFQPQVIFSDLGMPEMDGYNVARSIRSDARLQSAYLIALTGYGGSEARRLALAAGFDCYVTKPASVANLTEILGRIEHRNVDGVDAAVSATGAEELGRMAKDERPWKGRLSEEGSGPTRRG